MARRATAVSLACLLTVVIAPPLQLSAARAAVCAGSPHRSTPGPRSPKPEDVAKLMAELDRRLAGVTPPTTITVPTRVHVLTRGVRKVSDQAIRSQIAVLNSAYGGAFGGVDTGVRFRLDSISVRDNATWFTDPVGHEQPMKNALHKGGAETLNLYIAQLSELMLGFASYPYWYAGAPLLDGVVIDWRSLPGGAMTNYNRGFTGVHEIGHWLGLFHTFENGCRQPGDGIDDTPAEAKPTEACPAHKDTCPQAGPDPTRNFMDYAHDRCMAEFTQGQARRMHEIWAAYRHTSKI
ncbi:pregnancy-associated plasma protein-A [Nonomuraea polychroma]|uniref:Pregnancy-associated plasma protein-A n=1 Tax=Nonomuraea polychroma TaxID=46176 RepID=A0A438MRQ4_9ACTN|nr:zinc metalloprotease [Nonomuraea polychroma]RVX47906.1 pregnancy-associated plasma protein-A [Nonomuraea polychroma]